MRRQWFLRAFVYNMLHSIPKNPCHHPQVWRVICEGEASLPLSAKRHRSCRWRRRSDEASLPSCTMHLTRQQGGLTIIMEQDLPYAKARYPCLGVRSGVVFIDSDAGLTITPHLCVRCAVMVVKEASSSPSSMTFAYYVPLRS